MYLPKRPTHHVVDDMAVALVRSAVVRRGWVYRDLASDYGIDALIEIRTPDTQMSGAVMHVQIKGTGGTSLTRTVAASTVRYWRLSPVPVLIVLVSVKSSDARALFLEDYLSERHSLCRRLDEGSTKNVTLRFGSATRLEDAWQWIEEFATERHAALLDVGRYTMYSQTAQVVRWIDLLLNHGGDADKMLRWMRTHAPDDALTYNYGYAVRLRDQITQDPTLIHRIRQVVLDFAPELVGRI
jgi:hypothetical protein